MKIIRYVQSLNKVYNDNPAYTYIVTAILVCGTDPQVIIMTTITSLPSGSSTVSIKSAVDWLKNLFADTEVIVEVTDNEYEEYRMNRLVQERVNKLKSQLDNN